MQIVHEEAAIKLSVDGALGIAEASDLHADIVPLRALGKPVELDLGAAGHIHPSILQIFVALEGALAAGGTGFRVTRTSPQSADALALCGLGRWLSAGEGV